MLLPHECVAFLLEQALNLKHNTDSLMRSLFRSFEFIHSVQTFTDVPLQLVTMSLLLLRRDHVYVLQGVVFPLQAIGQGGQSCRRGERKTVDVKFLKTQIWIISLRRTSFSARGLILLSYLALPLEGTHIAYITH